MLIRELFVSDVTRNIPPVVYFHEQTPEKLAAEVSEYIVTGGWPEEHPNHRRVPNGIHEQYVRLLTGIASELDKPGGPELPNAWISGFYGSGKSIFAKLLGLSLDGVALPDGISLAEAWLRRNTSPRAEELSEAWRQLRQKIDPIAVVFDIGSVARDKEHIHATAIRQVQRRLGYCAEPLVADFELRLELDGEWHRFERTVQEVLQRPWSEVKGRQMADDDFSYVLSVMYPEKYSDPMAWITSRAGTHSRSESPEDAAGTIRDMLKLRQPKATLFLVVDEVSQYVLANKDRVDRLRAFATSLGSMLKGRAWLLALGQQKLDEEADDSFLVWAKDRFPPKLRVHLSATNIRDVVHKRLLQKRPEAEGLLRSLFEQHRPDLKLYGYKGDEMTPEEFIEVYPLLPGHVDLLLQITTALRTRSARAQGDDQAIRGLLQLLGELFRDQKLADFPVGALVTLDQIYEVQHTALDSDTQASMARLLDQCAGDASGLLVKVAKAVALLELIQETTPTEARLVAQCLYDRLDRGNQVTEVTEALEELRRRNLLGYSEKLGYKLQSSAGEEWERERRDIPVPRESINGVVTDGLTVLLAIPKQPCLQVRPFPWSGVFSDGRRAKDVSIVRSRDDAVVQVDFRLLSEGERDEITWVKRSAELALQNSLLWLAGEGDQVEQLARELCRSVAMVKKYTPRRESLNSSRKLLMQQEENRTEELAKLAREAIAAAWMKGRMYFRGRGLDPREQGASFALALHAAATRVLPDLFPHFVATQVQPSELLQLVATDLSGPSPKFLPAELGILELDAGRYVPACGGVVPHRVQEHVVTEGGLSGASLLAHFGSPPYGYTANVVKACVAGLLRGSKVRVQPEAGNEITAIRDAGVREIFEKDKAFRQASIFPAGQDDIGPTSRAKICKFFEQHLDHKMDREDHAIADAVASHFPQLAAKQREVLGKLDLLPGSSPPVILIKLSDVLEQCLRTVRQTLPTVKLVKKHLEALLDAVPILKLYHAELTADALRAVAEAQEVLRFHVAQLQELGVQATNVDAAGKKIGLQMSAACPWRDIKALDQDLQDVRAAYCSERQKLLQWQERQAEGVRSRVKARQGFSTLTAEQSHRVLRPITQAVMSTTAEAVAPTLVALKEPFLVALQHAEEEANETLDELLSKGQEPLVTKVNLGLRNRELASEADVNALVEELRKRLLEPIRAGRRVRLV